MRHLCLLFLLLIFYNLLNAQIRPTGLIVPSKEEYRRVPHVALPRISFGSGITEDYRISGILPPVDSQGDIGACTSWSACYYLLSYFNAIKFGYKSFLKPNGVPDLTKIMNPLYVHNQLIRGTDCKTCGLSNMEVLDFISNKGGVPFSDFTYTCIENSNNCRISPSPSLLNKAKQYKIVEYAEVLNPESKYHPGEKYEQIRNALLYNTPVVIGMVIDADFSSANNIKNYQWNHFNGSNSANHSMLCIGFSDKRQAILVINSWSINWGDQGFGWIHKDLLDKYLYDAFIGNPPKQFLIPFRSANDPMYTAQSREDNREHWDNQLGITEKDEGFFIKNHYLEFNALRIIPERVDKDRAIIKFFRKNGDDFDLLNIVNLKIDEDYRLSFADEEYSFKIYDISRYRRIGPRGVKFIISRLK